MFWFNYFKQIIVLILLSCHFLLAQIPSNNKDIYTFGFSLGKSFIDLDEQFKSYKNEYYNASFLFSKISRSGQIAIEYRYNLHFSVGEEPVSQGFITSVHEINFMYHYFFMDSNFI